MSEAALAFFLDRQKRRTELSEARIDAYITRLNLQSVSGAQIMAILS